MSLDVGSQALGKCESEVSWLTQVALDSVLGGGQDRDPAGAQRGHGQVLTSGLPPLVVDVEGTALVHAGDHLVVGAVEAVHTDHAGLLLGVGVVRVGGVQVILKHCQAIQVLDLRGAGGRGQWEAGNPLLAQTPSPWSGLIH